MLKKQIKEKEDKNEKEHKEGVKPFIDRNFMAESAWNPACGEPSGCLCGRGFRG